MLIILLILFLITPCQAGLLLTGTDLVYFDDNARFDASITNWAIEFWFKSSDTGNNLILIKKYGNDPSRGYEFNLTDSGRVTINIDDTDANNAYVQSGQVYDNGKWNCVFAYLLNGKVYLYVNNTLIGSSGALTGSLDSTVGLSIGSNGYDGQIAQIRYFSAAGMGNWDYYRTQYERFQMPDSNIQAHIPCWENTGTTAYTLDQPVLSTSYFTGSWGPDPPLIYQGGKLEDIKEIDIIIIVKWEINHGRFKY